jgi:hypothetical protein
MLQHARADAANSGDPVFSAVAAQLGAKLPSKERAAEPCDVAWMISPLHSGDWACDCPVRLESGLPPGFSCLACAAARAEIEADARFGGLPARNPRSIPRSINAFDVRRSLGGRAHELGVLHQVLLDCEDTATQLGVRTGGRLRGRHSHPAKRHRLWRKDASGAFTGFATSWPPDSAIVARSRCGRITADRRQPTCGLVYRLGHRYRPPNASSTAVGTQRSVDGPMDLSAWLT